MVLQEIFTERQIELILTALRSMETKHRALADRVVMGYGSARELAKKEEHRHIANEVSEVQHKIVEFTI